MSTATLAASRKVAAIKRGDHGRAVSVTLAKGFMLPDAPRKHTFPIKTVEEGHDLVRRAVPIHDAVPAKTAPKAKAKAHAGPPSAVEEPKRRGRPPKALQRARKATAGTRSQANRKRGKLSISQ